MLNIENTSAAWGEFLLKLANEATGDATQRDSSLVLAETLNDLALVMRSYAARLGVERLPAGAIEAAEELLGGPVEIPAVGIPVEPLVADAPAETVQEQLQSAAIQFPSNDHEARIFELEQTVALLSARLHALETKPEPHLPAWLREAFDNLNDRVTALENRQPAEDVYISQPYASTALHPDDMNPAAWGSIEQARGALYRRLAREHANRVAIRQTVLNAVSALAANTDRTPSEDAELRQHQSRSERLSTTDHMRDMKQGEIAALDDLDAARSYDIEAGWPE